MGHRTRFTSPSDTRCSSSSPLVRCWWLPGPPRDRIGLDRLGSARHRRGRGRRLHAVVDVLRLHPSSGEYTLCSASGPRTPGILARDLYTFGHFPLISGSSSSGGGEAPRSRPEGPLTVDDRWLLALSVVFFVAGCSGSSSGSCGAWRRSVSSQWPAAIGLCVLAGRLPGLLVVTSVAAVLAVMQAIAWHQFRNGRARAGGVGPLTVDETDAGWRNSSRPTMPA